jgi:ketosteroid isomerase-like protein
VGKEGKTLDVICTAVGERIKYNVSMKKIVSLLLVAFICFYAAAQSKKIREVLNKTQLLEDAVFYSKDGTVLETLFGKDLVYEHPNGKVETREEAIKGIIQNKSVYKKILGIASPTGVVEKGDSIITKKKFKATEKKEDATELVLDLTIEMVWMKEKGDWKLVHRKAVTNTL